METISPPTWLAGMMNQVTEQVLAADVLAPLGCHCYHNLALDEYEVTLFASLTEILGGELDGHLTASRFHLDILGLQQVFTEVHQLHWQSHSLGEEDELGPHVSIEGEFAGKTVWLRILAFPPERYEHGRMMNVYEGKLHDLWK